MEKAKFDETYCVNKGCRKKCWRYSENYEFEADKNYWFMGYCLEEKERERNERDK